MTSGKPGGQRFMEQRSDDAGYSHGNFMEFPNMLTI
jgi:hypothetical protein